VRGGRSRIDRRRKAGSSNARVGCKRSGRGDGDRGRQGGPAAGGASDLGRNNATVRWEGLKALLAAAVVNRLGRRSKADDRQSAGGDARQGHNCDRHLGAATAAQKAHSSIQAPVQRRVKASRERPG
jgi:hypothetical protein